MPLQLSENTSGATVKQGRSKRRRPVESGQICGK